MRRRGEIIALTPPLAAAVRSFMWLLLPPPPPLPFSVSQPIRWPLCRCLLLQRVVAPSFACNDTTNTAALFLSPDCVLSLSLFGSNHPPSQSCSWGRMKTTIFHGCAVQLLKGQASSPYLNLIPCFLCTSPMLELDCSLYCPQYCRGTGAGNSNLCGSRGSSASLPFLQIGASGRASKQD